MKSKRASSYEIQTKAMQLANINGVRYGRGDFDFDIYLHTIRRISAAAYREMFRYNINRKYVEVPPANEHERQIVEG